MYKILLLSPCDIFPPVDGNSMNIYNIVKYLCRKNQLSVLLSPVFSQGGEVDIAHPNLEISYVPPTWLDGLKYRSIFINPYYYSAAWKVAQHFQPDLIQCQVLYTTPAGGLLKKRLKKPLVLVQENVEYLKYKRFGASPILLHLLRAFEAAACRMADKIVAVSPVDKEFMVKIYGVPKEKIHVIQHCVDPEVFKYRPEGRQIVRERHGISPSDYILTFVGKLDTIPNAVAVRYISERIYPAILAEYPQTAFFIIGQNYAPLLHYQKERMVFIGFVSNHKDLSPNLIDYLSASDIVIIPLDSGSGTRVKILEAVACSRPIVSTVIGAEGLSFQDGQDMLLSEAVDEKFIDLILELMRDKSRREELGQRARERIIEEYNWEREIERYEEVYQEIESR